MRFNFLFYFFIFWMIGSGCIQIDQHSGNYVGTAIVHDADKDFKKNITVKAIYSGNNEIIFDAHFNGKLSPDFFKGKVQLKNYSSELVFISEGLISFNGKLEKISANCVASPYRPDGVRTKICFENGQFILRSNDLSRQITLYLKQQSGVGDIQSNFEIPAIYSVSQLRDRAKNMSFDSRYEFENLIEAQLRSKLKYLNLLPHLSNGSILGVATFSGLTGIIGMMGDLVPFLLPNRVLQASESSDLVKAERYSVQLMQLNAMQIVENLSISLGKNQEIYEVLQKDRDRQKEIIQRMSELEIQKKLPEGSSLLFKSSLNGLEQVISSLESTMGLEKTDLSLAAGFTNPGEILSVSLDVFQKSDSLPLDNLQKLQNAVCQNAPELLQLEALLAASKIDRISRAFQWIDPAGDSQGGFGFGLPTYIEIGSSSIRQLLVAEERVTAILIKKITDTYYEAQSWQDSYNLAKAGLDLQQQRVEVAEKSLQSASAEFAVQQLEEALTMLSVSHVTFLNAKYSWNLVMSQINRLLREGPYSTKHFY